MWDTRKTTPGLRALEKAAVRAGGAANHRGNLSEWVMFKDNHLTLLGIADAVAAARAAYPGKLVHVECDTVDKLREALEAGADAVLLDNMEPDEARRCVELADEHAAAAGVRRPLARAVRRHHAGDGPPLRRRRRRPRLQRRPHQLRPRPRHRPRHRAVR